MPENGNSLEDLRENIEEVSEIGKTPKTSGYYLQGEINGISAWLTADTGDAESILSTQVFYQIPEENGPSLRNSEDVACTTATRNKINELERAEIDIKMGDHNFQKTIRVADIQDDMLLEIDICETFHVSAKKKRIAIDGKRIPCIVVKSCTQSRKVYAANSYHIPPLSEMVLEIHLPTNDDSSGSDVIVEPTKDFSYRYPLTVAACLVDES